MRVTARSGLRLRAGPGKSYEIKGSFPLETLVTGLRSEGQWVLVDVEGDGNADGYMFGGFLGTLSGGFPIVPPSGHRPIDVARDEMALGVREIPGEANNNPRIVMYHATTSGGASPDETPWCSSFVNFCVEQCGLRGTDSKWAMSWHDENRGQDVTATPAEGDIAVFKRKKNGKVVGGHVGFYLAQQENSVGILGGNQGNRISIETYPKSGTRGSFHFELLSIRRSVA